MIHSTVIYHDNCCDGFGAAYMAWRVFGDSARYWPANHGSKPPSVKGQTVYVLDFCYPREVMFKMRDEAKEVIVLDHHISNQKECGDLDFCHFDMNRSGAGLAYDYFKSMDSYKLDKGDETLAAYIEDRDIWKHELPSTQEVNAYISVEDKTFESYKKLSRLFKENAHQTIVNYGRAILKHKKNVIKELKKNSKIVSFQGYKVEIVNCPHMYASDLLNEFLSEDDSLHFAIGWFDLGDRSYQYSVRANGKADASKFAKQFGGGGHKNAAGFRLKHLLFEDL